jgi:hypothetical protein
MDSLVLQLDDETESVWDDEIVFVVNGRDLRSLVANKGRDWIGPPTQLIRDFPEQLRGGPDRWEDPVDPWYDRAAILACGCGQPGCDAVLARITTTPTSVIWDLTDKTGEPLPVGPFEFDRGAYEAALELV